MISREWQAELLEKIDIEQLVGEYVHLVNKGGRLWGCCPFHHEKTPSFTVSNERGLYKCFGCGKAGNAIGFVMDMEHLSFPEACQFLADKVGMTPPSFEDATLYEERKKERNRVYEINRHAAVFFRECLMKPEGIRALDYFRKTRGFSDSIIKAFGLGYADSGWDSTIKFLQGKGYSVQEIEKAGLCRIKDDKQYDFFRNRPIMPIIDAFDNVIGFGGRALDPDEDRKYLNSPDTPAFNKSRNLYNLNRIKRQKNLPYVILAEGYMDVIALAAYGFQNAVATLGTALTSDQAKILKKRHLDKVYISYDGDEAGQKATMRALDILHEAGLEPRAVVIPGGQDPDEFLKANGAEAYRKLLDHAFGRLDYKFYIEKKKVDFDTEDGKETFLKSSVEILKKETSPIVREKYSKFLSRVTGFSERAIMEEIGDIKPEPVFGSDAENRSNQPDNCSPSEKYVIALLIKNPEGIDVLENDFGIGSEDFTCVAFGKIFSAIERCVKNDIPVTGAELQAELQNEEDIVKTCAADMMEVDIDAFAPGSKKDTYLYDCIKNIKKSKLENRKKQLIERLENSDSPEERQKCRNEIADIIKKLNNKIY